MRFPGSTERNLHYCDLSRAWTMTNKQTVYSILKHDFLRTCSTTCCVRISVAVWFRVVQPVVACNMLVSQRRKLVEFGFYSVSISSLSERTMSSAAMNVSNIMFVHRTLMNWTHQRQQQLIVCPLCVLFTTPLIRTSLAYTLRRMYNPISTNETNTAENGRPVDMNPDPQSKQPSFQSIICLVLIDPGTTGVKGARAPSLVPGRGTQCCLPPRFFIRKYFYCWSFRFAWMKSSTRFFAIISVFSKGS